MSKIVVVHEGQAVTSTLVIAKETGNAHEGVIKLVRKYSDDFQAFGPLRFEIRKGKPLPQGGFSKATEHAVLNEHQATLLLTFMRNSDIVRAFKKRLVQEFYRLAQQARAQVTPHEFKDPTLQVISVLLVEVDSVKARVDNLEGEVRELRGVLPGSTLNPKTKRDLQTKRAKHETEYLTVRELGKHFGCSAHHMRVILVATGLQEVVLDAAGRYGFILTEAGKPFAKPGQHAIRRGDIPLDTYRSVHWHKDVVDYIFKATNTLRH